VYILYQKSQELISQIVSCLKNKKLLRLCNSIVLYKIKEKIFLKAEYNDLIFLDKYIHQRVLDLFCLQNSQIYCLNIWQ